MCYGIIVIKIKKNRIRILSTEEVVKANQKGKFKMALIFKNPQGISEPAANYRHMAIIPPNKRLLILAGQIGNVQDGTLLGNVEEQYDQALKNIIDIVISEGGRSDDIARISIFLVEKPNGSRIRESNNKYFPSGPPAMSWLYVAGLFRPDVKVEIEGIAAVD